MNVGVLIVLRQKKEHKRIMVVCNYVQIMMCDRHQPLTAWYSG